MTSSAPIHDGLAPELAVELLTQILSAEQVSAYCYRSNHRAPDVYYIYFPLGAKMIFGCLLAPWPRSPADEDASPLGPQFWRYDQIEDGMSDPELELLESLENALHDWAIEHFGAAPNFEIVLK